jgi:hypothetical protein
LLKNSPNGDALKGHGFSRAANAIKSMWALAPEGDFCQVLSNQNFFSKLFCRAAIGQKGTCALAPSEYFSRTKNQIRDGCA